MKNLFLTLLIISCAKPTVEPIESDDSRLDELQETLGSLLEEAINLSDKNGWLVRNSCDSMLWTSLFGTATVDFVNISAAEKEGTGKFYRTPSKKCFEEERSGSTWSRDMSLGLLAYLISQKDLKTIERHIAFGESTGWVMGEGSKSRTVYSPAIISLWYKAAKHLGHDYGKIEVPNVYAAGLTDYQAHLQMLDIYINSILDGRITDLHLTRIVEHSDREPNSRFYQVLRGIYSPTMGTAVDACFRSGDPYGEYVRCDGERCDLAAHIFACGIITKFLYERGQ